MMANLLQWIRSIVFQIVLYTSMPVIGLIYLPWALVSRRGAYGAVHGFCRFARWAARVIVGLRSEIRGTPPQGAVMIAAKHQSFFDIIMIVSVTPHPRFIMKQELLRTPIVGWYSRQIGCIPVDRGKRGRAIAKLMGAVTEGRAEAGQLVIYPQGTRTAPGANLPYKIGTGLIYEELGQPCVPAGTNVGLFWPRGGVFRKPGLAVVEFLPQMPAGLPRDVFMARLQETVEACSNRLMAEAGFTAP